MNTHVLMYLFAFVYMDIYRERHTTVRTHIHVCLCIYIYTYKYSHMHSRALQQGPVKRHRDLAELRYFGGAVGWARAGSPRNPGGPDSIPRLTRYGFALARLSLIFRHAEEVMSMDLGRAHKQGATVLESIQVLLHM